jgi:hypothetical protein
MNTGAPEVDLSVPYAQQGLLRWLRKAVMDLQVALIPPTIVSNLRATALAGAILIDFTRADAESYILYINETRSINGSTRIDLQRANQYTDSLGAGSVTRYYAIKGKKGALNGELSPWVSATSLALGTPVVIPDPPPATEFPFTDQETDAVEVASPQGADYRNV